MQHFLFLQGQNQTDPQKSAKIHKNSGFGILLQSLVGSVWSPGETGNLPAVELYTVHASVRVNLRANILEGAEGHMDGAQRSLTAIASGDGVSRHK